MTAKNADIACTATPTKLSDQRRPAAVNAAKNGNAFKSNINDTIPRQNHEQPTSIWYTVSKWGLFVTNFLFWILGIGLICVAVWAHLQKDAYTYSPARNLYHVLFNLSYVMMTIGTMTVLVSFMGFVGSLRDNTCLLSSFSICVMAILIMEAITAIVAATYSQELSNSLLGVLTKGTISRYREDIDLDNFIDWIQINFQCCGYSSLLAYKDWSNNMYFNCTLTNPSSDRCSVPYSCCSRPDNIQKNIYNSLCGYGVQLLASAEASLRVHTIGCIDAISTYLIANTFGVVLGLSMILIPQVVAIYMASILRYRILEIVYSRSHLKDETVGLDVHLLLPPNASPSYA